MVRGCAVAQMSERRSVAQRGSNGLVVCEFAVGLVSCAKSVRVIAQDRNSRRGSTDCARDYKLPQLIVRTYWPVAHPRFDDSIPFAG